MAWTEPPRDWTAGELVTEAIMDTHIRDQFKTTPHLLVRKTADETVNNSTTLQNDDVLVATVGTTDVWHFWWYLIWNSNTTADLKIAWTFPASGLVTYSYVWRDSVPNVVTISEADSSSPTTSQDIQGSAAVQGPLAIQMTYVGGGTGGSVQLQWAQNTANVSDTIMKANSTLYGLKLA